MRGNHFHFPNCCKLFFPDPFLLVFNGQNHLFVLLRLSRLFALLLVNEIDFMAQIGGVEKKQRHVAKEPYLSNAYLTLFLDVTKSEKW